jgi:hypothetical protein
MYVSPPNLTKIYAAKRIIKESGGEEQQNARTNDMDPHQRNNSKKETNTYSRQSQTVHHHCGWKRAQRKHRKSKKRNRWKTPHPKQYRRRSSSSIKEKEEEVSIKSQPASQIKTKNEKNPYSEQHDSQQLPTGQTNSSNAATKRKTPLQQRKKPMHSPELHATKRSLGDMFQLQFLELLAFGMEVNPIHGSRHLIEADVIETLEARARDLSHAVIGHQKVFLPSHEDVFLLREPRVAEFPPLRRAD